MRSRRTRRARRPGGRIQGARRIGIRRLDDRGRLRSRRQLLRLLHRVRRAEHGHADQDQGRLRDGRHRHLPPHGQEGRHRRRPRGQRSAGNQLHSRMWGGGRGFSAGPDRGRHRHARRRLRLCGLEPLRRRTDAGPVRSDDERNQGSRSRLRGASARPGDLRKLGHAEGGTVLSSPEGIDCGPDCDAETAEFRERKPLVLTASAERGYAFVGWHGCEAVGPDECAVSVGAEATEVKAVFARRCGRWAPGRCRRSGRHPH